MTNLEGRTDIFVLKSIFNSEGVSHGISFGLFQYFKRPEDEKYYVRQTPFDEVGASFPHTAKDLGGLVAIHKETIIKSAGTDLINFSKKGYFPDCYLKEGDAWTDYEDLNQDEIEAFKKAYSAKRVEMKGH